MYYSERYMNILAYMLQMVALESSNMFYDTDASALILDADVGTMNSMKSL